MNQLRRNEYPDFLANGLDGILAKDRYKFKIKRTHNYLSFNIDHYFERSCSGECRWDYVIHNLNTTYIAFVEIHEAKTTGIDEVMRKYQWLKMMIRVRESELKYYKNKTMVEFYWLWTDKNKINPNTPQYKHFRTSKDYKHIKLQGDLSI
jgi:hypothetical protein